MDILSTLFKEILIFFRIEKLLSILSSGQYEAFWTIDGIKALLTPLLPLILIVEIIRGAYYKKFGIAQFRMPFIIYVFNRVVSRFVSIAMYAFCVAFFSQFAILKTGFTWYWFIYSYIIWELSHFVYHFLGHKVRLFWCLHSTHHAPEHMNLSVSFAHFFLEGAYADFIRTSICIVLGVHPLVLPLVMFVDGMWGDFIHISENTVKSSRFRFLNKILLTPSHHRVHHARNHLYMDTNYCNLLNIWDKIFGTYQDERADIQPEYGITRKINANNFWDVYFGEFYYLLQDIRQAPDLKSKVLYLFMPPGWSHTGEHQTAKVLRERFLKNG